VIVAVLLAISVTGQVWAISDENGFGMVGITVGQTARLNVVNAISDPGVVPCRVTLSFFDSAGRLLGGPDTKLLGAREAAFSDFAITDPGIRPGDRVQFRANVSLEFDNPLERRACGNNLIPTLEIFNTATGQTQILNPLVIRGFNPQPDPPGTPGVGHQ
jgi:hypothetical protein